MRKVIDIIAKEEKTKVSKVRRRRAKKAKQEITKAKAIFFALGAFLAIVVGAGVWFTFHSKLTITLVVKQDSLELRDEVEVNSSQTAVDFEKRIIPAQLLSQTLEKAQTFQATGIAYEDKKAQGVIRVFNNTNPPSVLNFVAGTRLLSSGGGKVFKAIEKITIAKPVKQGSKITPSFVDVKVSADEVGEGYNIGPSKFSLPGLVGSKLYYSVYGESDEEMVGGSVKEVAKVSANDLDNAKQDLYKILQDLIIAQLKENLSADFVVDKRGFLEDDFIFSCGELQDMNFTCSAKLSLRALVFNNNDLKNLTLALFEKQKIESQKLRPDALQISFTPKTVVTQSGRMILSLTAGVKAYENFSEEDFLNSIAGKNKSQIEEFIDNDLPQIGQEDFAFWPPWVKKAPKEKQDIVLRLTF